MSNKNIDNLISTKEREDIVNDVAKKLQHWPRPLFEAKDGGIVEYCNKSTLETKNTVVGTLT